jgi:hypothetical protein
MHTRELELRCNIVGKDKNVNGSGIARDRCLTGDCENVIEISEFRDKRNGGHPTCVEGNGLPREGESRAALLQI